MHLLVSIFFYNDVIIFVLIVCISCEEIDITIVWKLPIFVGLKNNNNFNIQNVMWKIYYFLNNLAMGSQELIAKFSIVFWFLYIIVLKWHNNIIFSVIKKTSNGLRDETPVLMYLWCSVSYMGAMLASNMALRYVNYPTQVFKIITYCCLIYGLQ